MSDSEESPHPSKRRRLDKSYDKSRGGSSQDELAATPDDEQARRHSSNRDGNEYDRSSHENSRSASSSPDELAGDAPVRTYSRSRASRSATPEARHRSGSIATTLNISENDHRMNLLEADDGNNDVELKDEEGNDKEQQNIGEDEEEEADLDMTDPLSPRESTRAPPSETAMPTPLPPPTRRPHVKPDRLTYKEKFILRGHQKGVSAVRFSPDGSMIASCSADATIKVWNTITGRIMYTFEGHLAGISSISWSPDGTFIVSGSDDKSIRLWNVTTGKPHPKIFLGHHNYVHTVAISPNKGNMLVSGSYDEAVYLWDVRSGRLMRTLPAHSDPVACVDIVHDGTLIVSCAGDGLIRVWDSATGQCLRTLVHDDNPPVSAVKFSPNGKYVLAWTLDDCVRLWDYVGGRCIKTYQGHRNKKYSICGSFGVYGSRFMDDHPPVAFAVSGSEDGAVVCWDVVSKRVLQSLEGHTDVVLGVDTYAPSHLLNINDNSKGEEEAEREVDDPGDSGGGGSVQSRRLIVTCSLDRTVRVWEEQEEEVGE